PRGGLPPREPLLPETPALHAAAAAESRELVSEGRRCELCQADPVQVAKPIAPACTEPAIGHLRIAQHALAGEMGDKIIIHWQIPPTSFPLTDVRRSLPDIRRALNPGAVDHEHYADNCVEIDMIKEYAGRWFVRSPLAQSSAAEKQH